jgi:hypothetical protein
MVFGMSGWAWGGRGGGGVKTYADCLEHRGEAGKVLHAGAEGCDGGLEEGERGAQRGDAVAVGGVGIWRRHGMRCCLAAVFEKAREITFFVRLTLTLTRRLDRGHWSGSCCCGEGPFVDFDDLAFRVEPLAVAEQGSARCGPTPALSTTRLPSFLFGFLLVGRGRQR